MMITMNLIVKGDDRGSVGPEQHSQLVEYITPWPLGQGTVQHAHSAPYSNFFPS